MPKYIGGCILLHLGLNLAIAIAKYQWDKKLRDSLAHSKYSKEVIDFGGGLTTFIIFSIIAVMLYFITKLNDTPPEMLNVFPYNLNIFYVQGLMPTIFVSFLCILFFSRSKALKREFKHTIYDPYINPCINVFKPKNHSMLSRAVVKTGAMGTIAPINFEREMSTMTSMDLGI